MSKTKFEDIAMGVRKTVVGIFHILDVFYEQNN